MPRLQSLELVPDAAGCAAVRRDWQTLRDAGLPSQLDHRGSTNAPHLTVVSALTLPEDAVELASKTLGALLPVQAGHAGLLVLSRRRVTVARAVEVHDDVVEQVLQVRRQVPDRDHRGWLAHVTLARGLDWSTALRALDLLGRDETMPSVVLSFTDLRRWDPVTGTVVSLVGRR